MEPEETTETPAQQTPEEIRDASTAALREAVERQEAIREERTVAKLIETINESAARKTPERDAVDAAIEIVAPAPEPRVPAQSAARTIPATLADWRYKTLPAWQREFRTPDRDVIVERYFRALHWQARGDPGPLMRMLDEDRIARSQQRAPILVGATGGTDGVFQGTGGELLPLPVSDYMNIALYRFARFRRLTRNFAATAGASLRVPLQSTISNSTWTAENIGLTEGAPSVVDHLNLNLQKLGTLATLSNEMIEDEVFGVVQWLIQDVAMEMAEEEDEKLYGSGDGSSEPAGLEANDTIVTMTTDPAYFVATLTQVADHFLVSLIDLPHLRKMFYALPEKERSQAIWAGPDSVMEIISSIDDLNGRQVFQQSTEPADNVGDSESSAAIGTIFRRPVHNLPGAELTPPVNSNTNRLYFFVPNRTYAVLEKDGVRVEASRDFEFNKDNTTYRFIRRVDGGVIGNNIAGRPQFVFGGGYTGAGTPVA